MGPRLPSVRRPRSFYDVFGVSAAVIAAMAIVLSIWHGSFVRLEMAVVAAVAFLWAGWAIQRILDRSAERARRTRR